MYDKLDKLQHMGVGLVEWKVRIEPNMRRNIKCVYTGSKGTSSTP